MEALIQRIGRNWVDKKLLDEGYGPEDFENEDDPIELPEMFDQDKKNNVGWLWCPICQEKTQTNFISPHCSNCGWDKDACEHEEEAA